MSPFWMETPTSYLKPLPLNLWEYIFRRNWELVTAIIILKSVFEENLKHIMNMWITDTIKEYSKDKLLTLCIEVRQGSQ